MRHAALLTSTPTARLPSAFHFPKQGRPVDRLKAAPLAVVHSKDHTWNKRLFIDYRQMWLCTRYPFLIFFCFFQKLKLGATVCLSKLPRKDCSSKRFPPATPTFKKMECTRNSRYRRVRKKTQTANLAAATTVHLWQICFR